jgi:acyl-CoA thioesterase-1
VVLAGMEAPTNYGEDYRTALRDMFLTLARKYRATVVYVPFLLEGVAGDPALNQADGIHPTAQGATIIAQHLYPILKNLVDELSTMHPVQ